MDGFTFAQFQGIGKGSTIIHVDREGRGRVHCTNHVDRILGKFDTLPLCRHFYQIAVIKYCGHLSNLPPPRLSTWFVHGPEGLIRVKISRLCKNKIFFEYILSVYSIQFSDLIGNYCAMRIIWQKSIWKEFLRYLLNIFSRKSLCILLLFLETKD